MEPDGYTQWDRLPLAYPRLHAGVRGSAPVDCLLRCVARIEPFELAFRAVADHGPAHPSAQRALAGLAESYTARLDAWAAAPDAPPPEPAARPLLIALFGVAGPLTLAAVALSDPRLSSLRWWPVSLLAAPLLLPLSWVALTGVVRLSVPRLTLEHALGTRACPDCSTPLAAAPDAIAPHLVEGVSFGPRACPRCRRPWPLLPPPTDAHPAR